MTRKFIALALALMPGVALAQSVPDKCKHLEVTFNEEWAKFGKSLIVDAVIQNDDKYRLQFANFFFNLYVGGNNKVGQVSGSVSGLEPGDQIHLKMSTMLQQIDNIGIWSVTCTFVQ